MADLNACCVFCDQPRTVADPSCASVGEDAPTRSRTSGTTKASTAPSRTSMAAESVIGSVSSRAPCQIGRTRPPTILLVALPLGVARHRLDIEEHDVALRGWTS